MTGLTVVYLFRIERRKKNCCDIINDELIDKSYKKKIHDSYFEFEHKPHFYRLKKKFIKNGIEFIVMLFGEEKVSWIQKT